MFFILSMIFNGFLVVCGIFIVICILSIASLVGFNIFNGVFKDLLPDNMWIEMIAGLITMSVIITILYYLGILGTNLGWF